jgi:alkylation response protein AidB-like acyl-CoA dehydrogenase
MMPVLPDTTSFAAPFAPGLVSQADVSDSDPLVLAASRIGPQLQARAEDARQLGRLTDDVVAALEDSGLLMLMAPRSRGGHQASLGTFVRVQEELARACGSTSWVCGVYAAALYMICSFTDQAQDEVFARPNPKAVAAFKPEGFAVPVDGGYRLTGTWRFCSGQHHADWALLSSVSMDSDGAPQPAQFLVPRADWVSADDWQVSGLSGTGSCSLSVDDEFVPEHRVLPFGDPSRVASRSTALAADPYFAMPFIPFFVTGAIGTPLGLASAAVELFAERIHKRGITYTQYPQQAEAAITHVQMDNATMKLDQAHFHAQRSVATVPLVAEDPGNIPQRVRCRGDAAWATKLCHEVVQVVQLGSGASAIHRGDPLSRIVGDIEALSVHSFLLHSTNAELYGRVLCGLEPGVPFI